MAGHTIGGGVHKRCREKAPERATRTGIVPGPLDGTVHRRDALRAGTCLVGASLGGCLDVLESESAWRDLVIDRPDEVYVPSKVDGMVAWGTETTDEYEVALFATRPHRFWTVTGRETNQIAMRDAHSAHLMAIVRDLDTGRSVPAEATVGIERDGDPVLDRVLWPMLSQRMGVHHGDNVALPGPGAYRATVRVVPSNVEYLGGFAGGFDPATLDLEFAYDPEEIESLDLTILEESRRGRPGAVEPMDHADHAEHDDHAEHGHTDHPPVPTAPPPDALPDVIADDAMSDYRIVVATADLEEGQYLIASLRTPYNGFPLPLCSLSAEIDRDDAGTESVSLIEAIHPEFGHHYGAVVDPPPRSELTVVVETPPPLARHEGYETAFFDLPEFSLRVPP
jgi:hypothetical protein